MEKEKTMNALALDLFAVGYVLKKGQGKTANGYMIATRDGKTVVAGQGYTLTAQDVRQWAKTNI